MLAAQKVEQLRGLTWGYDLEGTPVSDVSTDTSVSPEAAVGGPLGLVRDGDEILLDTEARRLDLLVPDAELARRRAAWQAPAAVAARGYRRLFGERVLQAPEGCDFDFLVTRSVGARRPDR